MFIRKREETEQGTLVIHCSLIKLRKEEIHHPEAKGVGELGFFRWLQRPVMGWALSKVLTSSLTAPSCWEDLGGAHLHRGIACRRCPEIERTRVWTYWRTKFSLCIPNLPFSIHLSSAFGKISFLVVRVLGWVCRNRKRGENPRLSALEATAPSMRADAQSLALGTSSF